MDETPSTPCILEHDTSRLTERKKEFVEKIFPFCPF